MPRFWMSSARAVRKPTFLRTSRVAPIQSLLLPYPGSHHSYYGSARLAHAGASSPPPHLFERVLHHAPHAALYESDVTTNPWTYRQLLNEAVRLSDTIQQALPRSADPHPRIAFLGSRGASYVAIQWATWLTGGVAVPLHPAHPAEELQYILSDADAAVLIVSDEFLCPDSPPSAWIQQLQREGKTVVLPYTRPRPIHQSHEEGTTEATVQQWLAEESTDRGAHIVYTSGTTGRPKGVVTTHAGLTAQIADVVAAWEMTERDHLLHFLPLHHVHGMLNNLLCVQYAGGSVAFLPSATPSLVWRKLREGQEIPPKQPPVTMLMAVPTIYMNLLEEIDRDSSVNKETAVAAARQLRVAISGSMACPVSILNRWEALTGLRLLERYGMTELGMALTNPLHGERHLGFVGQPFPSVRVRLVDPETQEELPVESGEEGELRVKGPTVFREYWRRPDATAAEFDRDGWFKTGDIAQWDVAHQSFRIRGRASADILKSGGYKISALDVERVLLTHACVRECAVFGIADDKWGQVVAAVVRVTNAGKADDTDALAKQMQAFCREHLADYCVPRQIFVVNEIHKNAMGKVNKKALAKQFGEIKQVTN